MHTQDLHSSPQTRPSRMEKGWAQSPTSNQEAHRGKISFLQQNVPGYINHTPEQASCKEVINTKWISCFYEYFLLQLIGFCFVFSLIFLVFEREHESGEDLRTEKLREEEAYEQNFFK